MIRILLTLFITIVIMSGNALSYRNNLFQLQVIASGKDRVDFTGWCDIEIGNRTLNRVYLTGHDNEMKPIEVHGQSIDYCEVTNATGRGELTLILQTNHVETYRKSTGPEAMKVQYGPAMNRFSTKPQTLK